MEMIMFVRQKIIGNKPRFYLVENHREGEKVRQKVLAYLGNNTTLEGAITQQKRWLAHTARPEAIERYKARIRKLESIVVPKNLSNWRQI